MIALLAILVMIMLSNGISNCNACLLVNSKIDFRIEGSGFHLLLKSNTTISSTTRFMNCEISYLFQIPKGAYIDTDSLNSSLTNHCFVGDRFNVEEPEWSSTVPKLHPILFHSRRVLRKVFVFNDQLNFTVHLRYHKPVEKNDASGSVVQFKPPTVYLKCEFDEKLMEEPSCRRRKEKIACECSSNTKCEYIRLNSVSSNPALEATVPVGNAHHSVVVVVATVSIVFACVLYILVASFKGQESNNKTVKSD